eukprot:2732617-Alexandrium_andersonii.AAC.1
MRVPLSKHVPLRRCAPPRYKRGPLNRRCIRLANAAAAGGPRLGVTLARPVVRLPTRPLVGCPPVCRALVR